MKDIANVEGAGNHRQHLFDRIEARKAREPDVAAARDREAPRRDA